MCTCVSACKISHGGPGQLSGVGSIHSVLCGFLRLNSGNQDCIASTSTSEPSIRPPNHSSSLKAQ